MGRLRLRYRFVETVSIVGAMSKPVDPTRVPRQPSSLFTADRERTIARLQDAVAADQLDLDELDERLDLAMRARTGAELDVLIADLPALQSQLVVTPGTSNLPAVVTPSVATLPSHNPVVSALFSSAVKRGRRNVPREMRAKAVFGSIVIDLREATFEPGITTLTCKSVFGSVEVFVPRHVRIDVDGSGIFGSFEEHGDNSLAEGSPDAPVLRILGKAIFGSVEARVGRTKAEAQRDKKRLGTS